MNAERLHAICNVVKKEMDKQRTADLLQQLAGSLDRVLTQQNPNQQNVLGQSLTTLYRELSGAPSDGFSPAWRQAIEEIGGGDLLGNNLAQRVRDIMERNQITLSVAREEVQEISKAVQQFKTAVDNVVSGLSGLRIGAEVLEPGECEVGVLVPRAAVSGSILEFGRELEQLDIILGTFSEVASGKRQPLEIKTISSSDLMIFLSAIPAVAACIAHATGKIIDVYKSLLEIKKLKGELENQGLTNDQLKGITDHTTSLMGERIEELAAEIIAGYYKGRDGARRNELKNGVRIALNMLANRIDQGFNIEVRAEALDANEPEGDDQEETDETANYIETVIAAAPTLRFLRREGGRLLQLPEATAKTKTTKKE